MGCKDALKSFAGGLVMTIVLVVIVPVVVNQFIGDLLADIIGDREILSISSDVLINLIVFLVVIGCMVLLGAGGILKRFGIVGVLGLVVAYWLLGDVTDAIIPIIMMAIVCAITWAVGRRRHGKTGSSTRK